MRRLRRIGRGRALLLALGVGGALFGIATAVQASIPDSSGVIHGCYYSPSGPVYGPVPRRLGDLRVIDTDKKHCGSDETPLAWSQTGPSGPSGPQGPGATWLTTTIPRGTGHIVATLDNGVSVDADCGVTGIPFLLIGASGSNLQISGTENEDFGTGFTTLPVDADGVGSFNTASTTTTAVDMDVIARDKSVGPFYRLDIHLGSGNPCPFWGMITPST